MRIVKGEDKSRDTPTPRQTTHVDKDLPAVSALVPEHTAKAESNKLPIPAGIVHVRHSERETGKTQPISFSGPNAIKLTLPTILTAQSIHSPTLNIVRELKPWMD